jgi:alpha-ketoglutarate-dependent taurine dioxygenase
MFYSRGKLFPSHRRPILFFHGGRMIFDFSRRPLLGKNVGCTREPLSGLSPTQMSALEAIESLARENQLYLHMKPGDLVYINNHAILHWETFQDDERNVRHIV